MKYVLILLLSFTAFQICSQELNDRIYPKEEDSIVCKITSVEKNWIYYDLVMKKKVKNDYIHMSDIKYYIHNGVKKKPYEKENKVLQLPAKELPDNTPKDTVVSSYLDSLNIKRSCFFLLSKNKDKRHSAQFRKLEIIDSAGKTNVLLPDKIAGYWVNGTFFRSFKTNYKGKQISFFAQELTSGKVVLYTYDGGQMDSESVLIFKKQSETEYNYVQENVSKATTYGRASASAPQANGKPSGLGTIVFYDEEPFLKYFQSYFSDCQDVLLKFKSKWYTNSNVTTMFKDYNSCK